MRSNLSSEKWSYMVLKWMAPQVTPILMIWLLFVNLEGMHCLLLKETHLSEYLLVIVIKIEEVKGKIPKILNVSDIARLLKNRSMNTKCNITFLLKYLIIPWQRFVIWFKPLASSVDNLKTCTNNLGMKTTFSVMLNLIAYFLGLDKQRLNKYLSVEFNTTIKMFIFCRCHCPFRKFRCLDEMDCNLNTCLNSIIHYNYKQTSNSTFIFNILIFRFITNY